MPVTLLSYVHLHVEFHVSNFEIVSFPYPIWGVLYYSIEVGGGVGGAAGNLDGVQKHEAFFNVLNIHVWETGHSL